MLFCAGPLQGCQISQVVCMGFISPSPRLSFQDASNPPVRREEIWRLCKGPAQFLLFLTLEVNNPMTARRNDLEPSGATAPRRRRPAATPELREQEMIALAFDLVEKKMRDGSATAAETVHFLKLGSENAKLEREKLRLESQEKMARIEQMNRNDRVEELFENAIRAFKGYSGEEIPPDEQLEG